MVKWQVAMREHFFWFDDTRGGVGAVYNVGWTSNMTLKKVRQSGQMLSQTDGLVPIATMTFEGEDGYLDHSYSASAQNLE